mmetsp:Transcript_3833/g.14233  ORF Transcript_3833/g.14233 Transcript_3833/m.14233 type:complete len:263 (+) Transcript_3833:1749-2537(+)
MRAPVMGAAAWACLLVVAAPAVLVRRPVAAPTAAAPWRRQHRTTPRTAAIPRSVTRSSLMWRVPHRLLMQMIPQTVMGARVRRRALRCPWPPLKHSLPASTAARLRPSKLRLRTKAATLRSGLTLRLRTVFVPCHPTIPRISLWTSSARQGLRQKTRSRRRWRVTQPTSRSFRRYHDSIRVPVARRVCACAGGEQEVHRRMRVQSPLLLTSPLSLVESPTRGGRLLPLACWASLVASWLASATTTSHTARRLRATRTRSGLR